MLTAQGLDRLDFPNLFPRHLSLDNRRGNSLFIGLARGSFGSVHLGIFLLLAASDVVRADPQRGTVVQGELAPLDCEPVSISVRPDGPGGWSAFYHCGYCTQPFYNSFGSCSARAWKFADKSPANQLCHRKFPGGIFLCPAMIPSVHRTVGQSIGMVLGPVQSRHFNWWPHNGRLGTVQRTSASQSSFGLYLQYVRVY